jgi:2'-5' RNA ligase
VRWEDPGATALVLHVPEADPVVGHYRRAFTPSGRDGMPPHVTLLAPFTPASLLPSGRVREVREVLGPFLRFQFILDRVERFSDGTLYLASADEKPFVRMSQALIDAFPEHPYPPAGATRVIPHLTVAKSTGVAPSRLDDIADELATQLPLEAEAREVLLMERDQSKKWRGRSLIEVGARQR